jgi:hypothetical protein
VNNTNQLLTGPQLSKGPLNRQPNLDRALRPNKDIILAKTKQAVLIPRKTQGELVREIEQGLTNMVVILEGQNEMLKR